MKNILNFFLSIFLGYILTFVGMYIFLEILLFFDNAFLDYLLSKPRIFFMQTHILLMGGIVFYTPLIIISFLLFRFFKRTILK